MTHKTTLALAITTLVASSVLTSGCAGKPSTSQDYTQTQPNTVTQHESSQKELQTTEAMANAEPIEQEPSEAMQPIEPSNESSSVMLEIAEAIEAIPEPEFERPAKTVFKFGFDKKELSANDKLIIEQHGQFLSQHPSKKIQLHGHSDAQGNSMYNQALATQRAEHVAELLKQQGVLPEQIEIFSWGSDKPQAATHDWKDNRRVEILYNESFVVKAPNNEEQI